VSTSTKLIVEGKNIELTDAIKAHAGSKLEKIYNHFDNLIQNHNIKVVLSVQKNKKSGDLQKAEITINLKGGHVIRCESVESNVYAAIDIVIDKIEGQLRKYKTRIYSKIHHGKSVKDYGLEQVSPKLVPVDLMDNIDNLSKPEIIKVKRFRMKPLDPENAIEFLEDCGHPFYMFLNVFSNRIACIYKRAEGGYGLIEPEFLQVSN
jgi:putative sigma-54 modulation protein